MASNGVFYSGGTGGTGLDLTSGDVTRINISTGGVIKFNNDYTFPTSDGSANTVLLTNGSGSLSFSTIPNASLDNSSITINGSSVSLGGSISVGTVTSVGITAGALIDVSNSPITSSGSITVDVDLSELTTSTNNGDGDFFAVIDSTNVQRKLTKGNINISGFNNDAGYITSAGNTNIYNTDDSLSGDRTLNQTEYQLNFRAASNEYFQAFKSNGVPIGTPRVRFEADDVYETVLELHSSASSTFIVQGYDVGQAPVFNVDGQGNLFAVSKSFLIEHPSDSSMSLRHGSLEGPEHGVFVRGKLDGSNTIELPSYWLDLVDEDSITVQLTPIGSHQNLYVKDIVDNKVIVSNSALLSSKVKCFYFVQAERKDIDKMIVEYPKGTQTI